MKNSTVKLRLCVNCKVILQSALKGSIYKAVSFILLSLTVEFIKPFDTSYLTKFTQPKFLFYGNDNILIETHLDVCWFLLTFYFQSFMERHL